MAVESGAVQLTLVPAGVSGALTARRLDALAARMPREAYACTYKN